MSERMLDLRPSVLVKLKGTALLDSIRAAEGRTILCEMVCPMMSMLYDVSNPELAAGLGADIVLLNVYDVYKPAVFGIIPNQHESVIEAIKRLSGRVVGINLEPVAENAEIMGDKEELSVGRQANRATARLAYEQGASIITLTGNPEVGVDNTTIQKAIAEIRDELGSDIVIIAGKMHSAGIKGESGGNIITEDVVEKFLTAGADIILVPAPGTVPGITLDFVKRICDFVHSQGALVMTTIGTSQEGADTDTIKQIALYSKMAGADIHHIGDAGYAGFAIPENILAYSIAIRGRRHTFRRMAMRV
ncbi:MAG: haloacid dehalogenase-like hydrolase [Pelosinus sp.]|nr:haloacid dehalogenase-like hydrolase [Pelosinus sp.]